MISEDEIERRLARDALTQKDIKTVMLSVRHSLSDQKNINYAKSLLPDSDYLPPYVLSRLVRADISEQEAAQYIGPNKAFFARLTEYLPDLLRYFAQPTPTNYSGLLRCIDDCHNDYHSLAHSLRRDRAIREAHQSLKDALDATNKAAAALAIANRHIDIAFSQFHEMYFKTSSGKSEGRRDIEDLIHELRMCCSVIEIVRETAEIDDSYLILSGNDRRSLLVNYAYQMITMWNGPKLVTTPGSDFSNLCSLLFEVVTGIPDESLAGAINRFARSHERRKWDTESEETQEDEDNNFAVEVRQMQVCDREIKRCLALLERQDVSELARTLLHIKIHQEKTKFETAESTYGPRQVWISQLNEEQLEKLRLPKADKLTGLLSDLDRAKGELRRATRKLIDPNS